MLNYQRVVDVFKCDFYDGLAGFPLFFSGEVGSTFGRAGALELTIFKQDPDMDPGQQWKKSTNWTSIELRYIVCFFRRKHSDRRNGVSAYFTLTDPDPNHANVVLRYFLELFRRASPGESVPILFMCFFIFHVVPDLKVFMY